jgi:hypothetical protein
MTTSTQLGIPPELQAEVLAALQVHPRPSLYITRAESLGNAGCLLVVDSDGPYEYGRVVGLALPATAAGWRLGCTRCHEPIGEDDSPRGVCAACTADRASQ